MDPIKKKLWTDALRSGAYEQGVGYLNYENKFCCLGVLCEVAMQNGCTVNKQEDEDRKGMYVYDNATAFVPNRVVHWAGLNDVSVHIVSGCSVRLPNYDNENLTTINDRGASFNEIADLIEQYL